MCDLVSGRLFELGLYFVLMTTATSRLSDLLFSLPVFLQVFVLSSPGLVFPHYMVWNLHVLTKLHYF